MHHATPNIPYEIERKFLINPQQKLALLAQLSHGSVYRQGYLCVENRVVVRVRKEGAVGKLTIKGKAHDPSGLLRPEYEYEIPPAHVEQLFGLCQGSIVEKTRYTLEYRGHVWEIDVFEGENAGLIVAEIELAQLTESFAIPPWLGKEVTNDHRYKNAYLAHTPYCGWQTD